MQWLDAPPLTTYRVEASTTGHLRLAGPTTGTRVASGVMAGLGGVFATMGLRFLRLPLPGPAKLVPLLCTAVGAGLAVAGGAQAVSRCSVEVKKQGVTFTWAVGPLAERAVEVAARDIVALEVTSQTHHEHDGDSTTSYVLNLVKTDGALVAFERFATRAQAGLRQQAIEAVLRPPPSGRRAGGRAARPPPRRRE